MSTESCDIIWTSNPLLPTSPPAFNLSQHHGLFQCVSTLHQVAKYWNFSFSISPFNEYSRLTSFSIDWYDLLADQRTQESSSTPQIKSINSLVLSFFYGPTLTSIQDYWKAITWTIRTFVGKVMCLLSNIQSRFAIAFLPRSRSLNFMAAVTVCSDFGAQVNKICPCFHLFYFYLLYSDRTECHDLSVYVFCFNTEF